MAPTPAMPTDALSGLALSQAIKPFQIVRRQALLADDQQRLAADLDDRLEVLQEIERQLIEAAGQHMRGRGADAERVAVGGRANRAADADAARGARDIFDDDRLPQNCPHSFAEEPRHRVGGPSGRKRHDHGDRPCRIVLRHGRTAASQSATNAAMIAAKTCASGLPSPLIRSLRQGPDRRAARGPCLRDKLFYALHNPVTLHVVCQCTLLRSRSLGVRSVI